MPNQRIASAASYNSIRKDSAEFALIRILVKDTRSDATRAAEAVRPKGLLIYATCSILTPENEDIVARFLAGHPGFTLLSQQLFGNPDEDCDTTFSAVMEKTSD